MLDRYRDAAEKSNKLLLSHLSLSQRYTWDRWGFFYVRGSDGNLYALRDGSWVVEIRDGKATKLRGVYPCVSIPFGDRVLAQKLGLETDASSMLKIACRADAHGHIPTALATGQFFAECRMFYGLSESGVTGQVVEDARKVLGKKPKRVARSRQRWYKRLLTWRNG